MADSLVKALSALDREIEECVHLEREIAARTPAPEPEKTPAKAKAAPPAEETPDLLNAESVDAEFARWEADLSRDFGNRGTRSARKTPERISSNARRAAEARKTQAQSAPESIPEKAPEVVFPPLRIFVYEPNPRVRNALEDMLALRSLEAVFAQNPDDLSAKLLKTDPRRCFAVALIGTLADVGDSLSLIARIRSETSHARILFTCDCIVSSLRRLAIDNGACYVLEKPAHPQSQRGWDPLSMDRFLREVICRIDDLYQSHKIYFDALLSEIRQGA